MFDELLSRHGLSLDRLRNFAAVVDAGSITRVADGDPARQSLVSRQIRELEEFFCVQLTRRKGKGLEPTPAGLELARQIRLQFQGLDDFRRAHAGDSVVYRFAAGNSVIEWILIPALGGIGKAVPGLHFHFLDTRSKDITAGLIEQRFDFGLVRKTAVVAPLGFAPLGKVGYALYSPLSWKKSPTQAPALAVTDGVEFLKEFKQAAAKTKTPLVPTHFCSNFTQAAQLVRSGAASAILPSMAEVALAGCATRTDLPWLSKYRRDIGLAWNKRTLEMRPKARELLQALREILPAALARHSQ